MLFRSFAGAAVGNSPAGGAHTKHLLQVVDGHGSSSGGSPGRSFLVEAFLPDVSRLSCEQKQYLTTLGFRLSVEGGAGSSLCDSELPVAGGAGFTSGGNTKTTADNPGGCYKALVSQTFDRTLVEGCCEVNSLLQRSKSKYSRGCRVVPVTKDDDFASEAWCTKVYPVYQGPQ